MSAAAATSSEKATFAGGCFWCVEAEYASLDGVISVTSGYTGGEIRHPTYEQVSQGNTGHVEAIEVVYDPAKITYERLLEIFWDNIDPFDAGGQFCDKGSQYQAGIFYHSDVQRKAAEASRKNVERHFSRPVATIIHAASEFYPAEDYHQEYHIKNRTRYAMYRAGCGRDERLDELQQEKHP